MGYGQPPGGRQAPADVTQPGGGRFPIRLRVQLGANIGRAYTMSSDTLTIGRAPDNDLTLDSPQVSRYHARLVRQGSEVLVEDLGSTNGTLVNGRRITGAHSLQPTETIAVGGTVFSVEGSAAPDTLGMPPLSAQRSQPPGATAEPPARSGVPWLVIAGLAGLLIVVVLILALGGMLSWLLSSQGTPVASSVPSVFVQSPVAGSEVRVNQPVTVSAICSDANGVVRVELWVAGVLVAQQASEGQPPTTLQAELNWTPTAPGGYTLELKAYNTRGAVSEPTALLVIAAPEPGAQDTETPTSEPTPEPSGPTAVTTADLNVRQGPGQDYTILGLAPAGTELQIVGRDPAGTWWLVVYPPKSDGRGWIFANFTSSSNTDNVPVVVTPGPPVPSPTEIPLPSPTYTRVVKPKPTVAPTPLPTPATGPIVDLSATRTSIARGECVTLQWHIEGVKTAYLTGGEFGNLGITGPYGSRDACPTVTTTYILRADTDTGGVERGVTVEVGGAPPSDDSVTINATGVSLNSEGSVIAEPLAGDDGTNRGMRALLTFDLTPLVGAPIGTAYLDLATYGVVGNPFGGLGALDVEEIGSQGAPNRESYAREATTRLAALNDPAGLSQSIDVTGRIAQFVSSGKLTYVVRLRFVNETNQNNVDDYVKWSGVRLVVRFRR